MQGLYPLSNPSFLRPLCRLIQALLGSEFVIGYNYWQTAVVAQDRLYAILFALS